MILDGKQLAKEIKEELRIKTAEWKAKGNKAPHLAAILVGEDGASKTYVNSKVNSCKKIGFDSTLIRLEESVSEESVLKKIEELNNDPEIDGFIVQLPLPKHIDETKVLLAIDPKKDVDGFHPENLGRMVAGLDTFIPATPLGIMMLLSRNNIKTSGMDCVVIGRSNIVGKPMSILLGLGNEPGNCTVTLTHSRTKDLKEKVAKADLIIAALGKPEFVTADMVKEGATVIDVGITRVEDDSEKGYTLKGDVKYDEVAPKCAHITPVPGGVGPMTVTALLINTWKAQTGESLL